MKVYLFLFSIILIGSLSALYPGETTQINLLNYVSSVHNISYSTNGNFSILLNGTKVDITAEEYIELGTYYVTIFVNGEEIIVLNPSSGGSSSGSSSNYVSKCSNMKWDCGEYGECVDEVKIRKCTSNCGTEIFDYKQCEIKTIEKTEQKEETIILNEEVKSFFERLFEAIKNFFRRLFR